MSRSVVAKSSSMPTALVVCAAAVARHAALVTTMSKRNTANLPERVMGHASFGCDGRDARGSLSRRDPHVAGVDGELEAGQEAHAEQAIDALSKGAFGIVLNDDW